MEGFALLENSSQWSALRDGVPEHRQYFHIEMPSRIQLLFAVPPERGSAGGGRGVGARTGADVATGCVEVLTGQLFAGGLHLLVGDEHRQGREDDAANCEQKRDAHQTKPSGERPGGAAHR